MKSQGFDAFVNWIKYAELQSGITIQEIHIDNGTEFSIKRLTEWYRLRSKKLTTIAPDCLSQNPIAERDARIIIDGACTANL